MSKKFRNSLIGFNKDDVMAFVLKAKETENTYKNKINELNDSIISLENEISGLQSLYKQTADVLEKTEKQLDSYRQREEALTQLSESIGRLYLVAKANAEAVTSAANEAAEKSLITVDKNIDLAEKTEIELQQIGEVLNEKTREYLATITDLQKQLSATGEAALKAKEFIAERQAEISEAIIR